MRQTLYFTKGDTAFYVESELSKINFLPQRRGGRGEEVFLICGETTANQKGSSLRETDMLEATRFSKEYGFDPIAVSRLDQRQIPSATSAALR